MQTQRISTRQRRLAVLTDVGDVDVTVTLVPTAAGPELVLRPMYSRKPFRIPLSEVARRLLGPGGELGAEVARARVHPGEDPGQMWLILPVPPGSRLETGAGPMGARIVELYRGAGEGRRA